jgi:hypothetical protein
MNHIEPYIFVTLFAQTAKNLKNSVNLKKFECLTNSLAVQSVQVHAPPVNLIALLVSTLNHIHVCYHAHIVQYPLDAAIPY